MKTILDYADLVKEQHALNTTIAPVETDLTSASKAYAVGQKFVYDGVLYQAKTAIAQGAALVLNTNYEAADDVSTEIEALTKEVAATLNTLGAKNFLETLIGSGTTQGVTYTINADGSITLNGTCTAWTNIKLDYIAGQKNIPSGSYILNGSISGNNKFRLNTYVDGTKMAESENGNEASFTIPSTATEVYTRFEIDSTATFNNETFYPMIRLSSIEDDTYAPYAKTNRKLTAENQTLTKNLSDEVGARAALGAHQLLEIINSNPTVVTATIDKNGITFSSYTPPYNLEWYISPTGILKAGTYTMSNKQTGVSLPLYVKNKTTNTSIGTVNPNESLTFTLSTDSLVSFNYWLETNNTFTGNIKPLLKLASDTNDEFMLYVKPNRELTEDTEGLIENVENMGALNLSNNTAASTTMFNGNLTVTRNSDGTYILNGNSTGASEQEYYTLSENFEVEQGKTYTISGGVANDSGTTQRLWVDGPPFPSGHRLVSDAIEASGTKNTQVAQSTGTVRVVLFIYPNQTYSNVKIKPMVIKGESKVFDYAPYAKTNRELTEDAIYKKGDTIAISSNPLYLSALFQDSKHLRLTIPINKPISASGATVTINSAQVFNNGNYEEISSGLTATAYKVDGIGLYVVIENAVDFTTFTAFANATIRFSNVSIAFT